MKTHEIEKPKKHCQLLVLCRLGVHRLSEPCLRFVELQLYNRQRVEYFSNNLLYSLSTFY